MARWEHVIGGQVRCMECANYFPNQRVFEMHQCVLAAPIGGNEMAAGSAVLVCGRGGEIIRADIAGGVIFWANPKQKVSGDYEEYALCPDCARDMYEFLNIDDNRQAVKAFDPEAEREARIRQADTTTRAIEHHVEDQVAYDPNAEN